MIDFSEIAIVILAAGNSSRMGASKQMLTIGDSTLLERSIKCAVDSVIPNITVVLGSNAEVHKSVAQKFQIDILINSDWSHGMGNTLKFSLKKVIEKEIKLQAILFLVCDQPLLSPQHIDEMVDIYVKRNPIAVASGYNGTYGIPVLFDRMTFSKLLSIDDRAGAKEVLKKIWDGLLVIPFNGGEIDIDTPSDYNNFIKNV